MGGLPMLLIWSVYTESAIVWLGFDAETAALGQSYALPYNVYHLILGIDLCLKTLMACTTDHEYTSLVMQTCQQASHVLVIVIMAWHPFGIQTTSLVWIGWVQVLTGLMVTMMNYGVAIQRGWLDEYWEGFVTTAAWKVCFFVSFSLVYYVHVHGTACQSSKNLAQCFLTQTLSLELSLSLSLSLHHLFFSLSLSRGTLQNI
jgi:hypothetical protein